ncbi:uncharacterized protein CEXT_534661 [Caerostris extrusa]|uniref:Uncharacterized protein n=1 Tax=Caerostris extrusa TaxID=172846 RepID=A0AAV4P019_CAEEX|nr:uncharacterized protein CEXT_534661 [Caerostris extrusa]
MLWFLATIANFWCLNDLFYSIHIFTIIARAIALVTWWTIRYKRKALKDLLMFLKFMFKNLKLQTNLSSRILIKSSPWLMLIISFLPVLMWMAISTPQLDNCELFWATVQPDIYTYVYISSCFHCSNTLIGVFRLRQCRFYTFESSVLYVAVVLFADKLQLDCNVLRKSYWGHPDVHSGRNTWKAIEKCSQLFEDKEDIKLTAWKMLRLKKKVLFTTATYRF